MLKKVAQSGMQFLMALARKIDAAIDFEFIRDKQSISIAR
ncbi:hypothetical protein DES54_101176 [Brenneria salicis ATCC 15712 = DSM 30166]|uniref:Uncharacterized protein n=1 Tax=Brenneria salicis ATCC 15712 = DSM 30166 TaxID=714314 RepID=A0A366IBG1_9GAMM|nr:hypothetical protein DES54_101176 [Brenneria salicis ATCC 15712 = DSM 30166]